MCTLGLGPFATKMSMSSSFLSLTSLSSTLKCGDLCFQISASGSENQLHNETKPSCQLRFQSQDLFSCICVSIWRVFSERWGPRDVASPCLPSAPSRTLQSCLLAFKTPFLATKEYNVYLQELLVQTFIHSFVLFCEVPAVGSGIVPYKKPPAHKVQDPVGGSWCLHFWLSWVSGKNAEWKPCGAGVYCAPTVCWTVNWGRPQSLPTPQNVQVSSWNKHAYIKVQICQNYV